MKLYAPKLALPATPDWDWSKVHRHWVDGDPYQPDPLTPEYYRIKYAVALWTQAKSICEIGVRAGYSAAAFFQAKPVRYVGLDSDEGHHGGVQGYIREGRKTLAHYAGIETKLMLGNTQQMTALPDGPYDLVHIDGDHTYAGARHDIRLALESGSTWILVDDVDFLADVDHAVRDAITAHEITEAYYVPDQGYRGNVLLRNPHV